MAQGDRRIFRMVWHWCRRRHRNKSWTWIKGRYFQSQGHRHWAFTGARCDGRGKDGPIERMGAGKVGIRRYRKVRADANPYDPGWELYLEERRRWQLEGTLAGRSRIEYLGKAQGGRCPVCQQALLATEKPWHLHHRHWRSLGGSDTAENLELFHGNCHRQIHARKKS